MLPKLKSALQILLATVSVTPSSLWALFPHRGLELQVPLALTFCANITSTQQRFLCQQGVKPYTKSWVFFNKTSVLSCTWRFCHSSCHPVLEAIGKICLACWWPRYVYIYIYIYICSHIYLLFVCLFKNIYPVPPHCLGTVWGAGCKAVNKRDKFPALREPTLQWGRQTITQ